MTVANNREYQEQVRPLEKAHRLESRLEQKVVLSSDLEGFKDVDTLAVQANRLENIGHRLVNQVNLINDRLHRGANKPKEGIASESNSTIATTLNTVESLLELTEKELIVLGDYLG